MASASRSAYRLVPRRPAIAHTSRRTHHYWSTSPARNASSRQQPAFSRSPWRYTSWYPPLWLRATRGESYSSERREWKWKGEEEEDGEQRKKAEAEERAFYDDADRQLKEQWERLRTMMEQDPYKVFFGRTQGVWNPFGRAGQKWGLGRSTVEKDGDQGKRKSDPQPESTASSEKLPSSSPNGASDADASPIPSRQAEYYIDPISLRKVPCSSLKEEPIAASVPQSRNSGNPHEGRSGPTKVPVKQHQAPVRMTDLGKEEIDALFSKAVPETSRQPSPVSAKWLKREGFVKDASAKQDRAAYARSKASVPLQKVAFDPIKRTPGPKTPPENKATEIPKAKLQAAIDRTGNDSSKPSLQSAIWEIDGDEAHTPPEITQRPSRMRVHDANHQLSRAAALEYDPAENGAENIDQLRAEDIRAAARQMKPKTRESAKVKDWYWERFEKGPFPPSASQNGLNDPNTHLERTNRVLEGLTASLMRCRKELVKIHGRQVSNADVRFAFAALWVKFEAFRREVRRCARLDDADYNGSNQDEASVSQYSGKSSDLPTSILEHGRAHDAAFLENANETRQDWADEAIAPRPAAALQTVASQEQSTMDSVKKGGDKATTRDVAGKGAPDQEKSHSKRTVTSPASGPDSYRILAIDEMNNDVISATAKSSLMDASETSKTPASILMNVERPERFITQMQKLEDEGYELVDGDRRMLVFKKTNAATSDHAVPAKDTGPKSEPPSRDDAEGSSAPTQATVQSAADQHQPGPQPPLSRAFSKRFQRHGRFRRPRSVLARVFRVVGAIIGNLAVLYVVVDIVGRLQRAKRSETREKGNFRREDE